MTAPPKRIRVEFDERRSRGVHAAIREALNAQLLTGELRDGAREVLNLLDTKVPGWLQAGPIGGEAGYLIAAETVLRALVDGEDRGRPALSESELLAAIGDAKPLGSTAADVFARLRREKLIIAQTHGRDEPWVTAAPAGRRFLHRDVAARQDAWTVRDADGLLDLIYAEHHAGDTAHRPSVQAIGRLADERLGDLCEVLVGLGLLEEPAGARWLVLTVEGVAHAWKRWKESAPPGVRRFAFDRPPAPPLPYQRRLPIHISREDREHPPLHEDAIRSWCVPANWLQRSSGTKLFATLRRDGAVQWTCNHHAHTWLVYLQAFTAADAPAYADPAAGVYNRPLWRPTLRA